MRIKLIVGLGNPGKEYTNTRHNVGFMVMDEIANKLNLTGWKERYGGLYLDAYIGFNHVILLKPQKYMNVSGDVLIEFVRFFDIKTEDILVINDDLDLPLGVLKLKERGSSGGHNGLKNIESQLKTDEYKRIKIGISNDKTIDTKDYVLGKLSQSDKKIIKESVEKAATIAIDTMDNVSFQNLMNKYNTKVKNN